MKGVQIVGSSAEASQITVKNDLPRPTPKGQELLVKVHAAGLTADEINWPELWESTDRVPGHDISGTIDSVGPNYSGVLSVGDSVYAMIHASRPSGQAEYAIVLPEEIAPKPISLAYAEAAALPIPVLTVWEAIFEHAKLRSGARILVTGASGAVGVMYVQLASKLLGAEVIALASSKNHAYLKELGASQTIDYQNADWAEAVGKVEVVFDTVGGDILSKCWDAVTSDGMIITVADPPPEWEYGKGKPKELDAHPNVKWMFFILSPSGETLVKISKLIDDEAIKPFPAKTFPIDEAAEAWKVSGSRGRGPGEKVVIEFA